MHHWTSTRCKTGTHLVGWDWPVVFKGHYCNINVGINARTRRQAPSGPPVFSQPRDSEGFVINEECNSRHLQQCAYGSLSKRNVGFVFGILLWDCTALLSGRPHISPCVDGHQAKLSRCRLASLFQSSKKFLSFFCVLASLL